MGLAVGTKIVFNRDLYDGACEDHPGFDYASKGMNGEIVSEKNEFGYGVVCPSMSPHKFRAEWGRDFFIISEDDGL